MKVGRWVGRGLAIVLYMGKENEERNRERQADIDRQIKRDSDM